MDGVLLYRWDGQLAGQELGGSVAPAGDVDLDGFEDVLAGSGYTATPNAQPGIVYLYSGRDGSLLRSWSGQITNDKFGASMAGLEDVDGDGVRDILIGATNTNPNGVFWGGSVYLYSGASGALLYRLDGTVEFESFGYAVDGVSDLNGDGVEDFIVGAPFYEFGGLNSPGRATLYSGADGSVLFRWTGANDDENLGRALADAGDVNRDGVHDLVIGARFADPNGMNAAGSTFLFSGSDGSQLYQWDGEAAGDHLGWSVAGAGDVDGDGWPDVIAGAANVLSSEPPPTNRGAAYLFSGRDGSLLQKWVGTDRGAQFGHSVGGLGDLNQDGFAEVIVGARLADGGGQNSAGLAAVYRYSDYLQADAENISATTGGVLNLSLGFADTDALYQYAILVSVTGTGPSTLFGVEIPLTEDAILQRILLGEFPPMLQDGFGSLDVAAEASASFTVPPNPPAGLVGTTRWFAAVSIAPSGGGIQRISVAVPLTILP